MTDNIYIGTSQSLDLDAALEDACAHMTQLGIPLQNGDIAALEVKNACETRRSGIMLDDSSYVRLLLKNADSYVGITQFQTEFVPGFIDITEPSTISIHVWVGADVANRVLAASVAAAVAARAGSKIYDPEHDWSDQDWNSVEEFMAKVKGKYRDALTKSN